MVKASTLAMRTGFTAARSFCNGASARAAASRLRRLSSGADTIFLHCVFVEIEAEAGEFRQVDIAVLDAKDVRGFDEFARGLPLLLRKIGVADDFLPLAVRHGATRLNVAGESERCSSVLNAGHAEGFGQHGYLSCHKNAAANSGIGLKDIVGLVQKKLDEFISAFCEFAASDEDIDFRSETGGSLDIVAVEGLFEPVRVMAL